MNYILKKKKKLGLKIPSVTACAKALRWEGSLDEELKCDSCCQQQNKAGKSGQWGWRGHRGLLANSCM
jgi:hypothetical protein